MDKCDLSKLRFRQNEKIHFTTIDNEMGFMNVDKGQYYATNEVGTTIWNLLTEPKSIDEIVDVLLLEYDIQEKQCKTEVEEFILSMLKQELILSVDTH